MLYHENIFNLDFNGFFSHSKPQKLKELMVKMHTDTISIYEMTEKKKAVSL